MSHNEISHVYKMPGDYTIKPVDTNEHFQQHFTQSSNMCMSIGELIHTLIHDNDVTKISQ